MTQEADDSKRKAAGRKYLMATAQAQKAAEDAAAARAEYDALLWEAEAHKTVLASGLLSLGRPVTAVGRTRGMPTVAVDYAWGRISWDGKEYVCSLNAPILGETCHGRFQHRALGAVLMLVADTLRHGIDQLTEVLNDVSSAEENMP